MKKILFVVGNDEYDYIGLKLSLAYPYGKAPSKEWRMVLRNKDNSTSIKKLAYEFDILYEIQLSSEIRSSNIEDVAIVSNIHTETLSACSYIHTPYILWDEHEQIAQNSLRRDHLTGVTIRYTKTNDAQYDFMRIKTDFLNIVYQRISGNMPKQLYKVDRLLTQVEQKQFQLYFQEYKKLDPIDKKLLSLPPTDEYMSTFVGGRTSQKEYYCYINKKIRDVIHFDAWLQLSVKKTD